MASQDRDSSLGWGVAPPAIELRDVWAGYNGHAALEGVTFSIERGCLAGLVGPNGSGKSTLLKVILGMHRPQRGEVLIFGQPAQRSRLALGYMPQLELVDWNFPITVFDAVMMAARSSPGELSPNEIWCFEVLSSTERGWRGRSTPFCPNIYVNIALTIETKKRALAAYSSELRQHPHPRSLEGVENLARKRGNEVGLQFAECFELVRRVVL